MINEIQQNRSKHKRCEMKFFLKPIPPFEFTLHFKFFGFNRPSPEIIESGVYKRALRLKSGRLVPLKVHFIGTVERPNLEIRILRRVDEKEENEVANKLSWIFNINYDLKKLYMVMNKDSVLKEVKQRLYGLRPFNYSTVFEGVIKSIIQQQISLIGSMHIISRLIEKFGDCIRIGNEIFYEFPSVESLAKARTDELKMCGLSKQKSKYIKEFSERVEDGEIDLENLKMLPTEHIIKELTKFKGIGRWTAELVTVTSIGKDTLPADDLGARRAVSKFYFDNRIISGDELREFSKRWGEFRGIITYYLICAERLSEKK